MLVIVSMQIFVRHFVSATESNKPLGPLSYFALPLSATTFYEPLEVETMMESHVQPDGNVDSIFVRYENENIPITV